MPSTSTENLHHFHISRLSQTTYNKQQKQLLKTFCCFQQASGTTQLRNLHRLTCLSKTTWNSYDLTFPYLLNSLRSTRSQRLNIFSQSIGFRTLRFDYRLSCSIGISSNHRPNVSWSHNSNCSEDSSVRGDIERSVLEKHTTRPPELLPKQNTRETTRNAFLPLLTVITFLSFPTHHHATQTDNKNTSLPPPKQIHPYLPIR